MIPWININIDKNPYNFNKGDIIINLHNNKRFRISRFNIYGWNGKDFILDKNIIREKKLKRILK
jgi:hypothetical protein